MNHQVKRLTTGKNTYTLDLTMHPAGWECRVFQGTNEMVDGIRKATSEHEAKFLGHVIAYDLEGVRRDRECEAECESGWSAAESP
jgi:hypothetical protein